MDACYYGSIEKQNMRRARWEEILPGFFTPRGRWEDAEETETPMRVSGMPGADGGSVLWGTCQGDEQKVREVLQEPGDEEALRQGVEEDT